ncbi:MAG: hypothetical protein AAFX87_30515 [Bacteroidota bacterium]
MERHKKLLITYGPLVLILIITLFNYPLKAQDKVATLPDGQKVILHADKTWDYYEGISYDFDFSTLDNNKIPDFFKARYKR